VSPKLRDQLQFTLLELERLRLDFGARIREGADAEISDDECIVLSTALHSFYNLCEGALKAIAAEFDEIPDGPDWHTQLLTVFDLGSSRSGFELDEDLRLKLAAFMRFRHVFRHIYVLDIDAERLRPLLAEFDSAASAFENRLSGWLGRES
jgi:hypothetical protein